MPQSRASWGSNTAYGRNKRRIRYWADKRDGKGYRRCSEIIKGTKRDADAVLSSYYALYGTDTKTPTLNQCYEFFYKPWLELRYSNKSISYSTYSNRLSAWENHIKPVMGDKYISTITPPVVQDWILTLPTGSARSIVGTLQAIIDRAAFYNVNTPNIKVKYEYPRHTKTQAGTGSYSIDELKTIWDALYNTDIEVPFLLQAFGSCRVGESLAVKVDEVEYDGDNDCTVIEIKRQVLHTCGVSQDGKLKTPQSHRYIVLCGKVGERLRNIAAARASAGFVWMVGNNNAMAQRTYNARFKSIVGTYTDLPAYPPTTLRPSWQTIAKYTLNIQPTVIERLMGHLVAGVTGANYDRPKKEDFIIAVIKAYSENPYDAEWEFESKDVRDK